MRPWSMTYLAFHALLIAPLLVTLAGLRHRNPHFDPIRGFKADPKFYLLGLFFGVLPDLDHLVFWEGGMLEGIVPTSWERLVAGLLEIVPYSFNQGYFLLHYWIFPLSITLLGLIFYALAPKKGHWQYLMLLAAGWSLHLMLDGVIILT